MTKCACTSFTQAISFCSFFIYCNEDEIRKIRIQNWMTSPGVKPDCDLMSFGKLKVEKSDVKLITFRLKFMWLTAPSEVCWPLYYVSSQMREWLEKQTDSMFRTQNGSLKLFVMDLGWHPSICRSLDLVSVWWFFDVESCAVWLRDFAAGSNRCWVLTDIHQLIEEFVICLSWLLFFCVYRTSWIVIDNVCWQH